VAFGNEEMLWETNAPLPTPRGEMGIAA